jgi:hypothetical protein
MLKKYEINILFPQSWRLKILSQSWRLERKSRDLASLIVAYLMIRKDLLKCIRSEHSWNIFN